MRKVQRVAPPTNQPLGRSERTQCLLVAETRWGTTCRVIPKPQARRLLWVTGGEPEMHLKAWGGLCRKNEQICTSQKGNHEWRPREQKASNNTCIRNSVCTATSGGLRSDRINFIFLNCHAGSRVEGGFKKNKTGVLKNSCGHFLLDSRWGMVNV